MAERFTWIPFYGELAELLVDWEDRQGELISFLERLRSTGLIITPLTDQDEQGGRFLLKEIDPFTFFGVFNRGIRDEERLRILAEMKKHFDVKAPLPEDRDGIPILNNQRSWFFPYQYKRRGRDIPTLWQVFRLALDDDPVSNSEFRDVFDRALQVWGVATNLTMGLYWIRPQSFLNLDKTNRDFLKIDLPGTGLSAAFFAKTIKTVRERGESFPEISYAAWMALHSGPPADPGSVTLLGKDNNYWLVGAYWRDVDPPDQTQRFLDEGTWQNGYKDRYLGEVGSIKVGDRIAIKSTSTQKKDLPFDARGKTVSKMSVKAIGTIVANRNDGRTVDVEWDGAFEPVDWFFFTNRRTVWHLRHDDGYQHKEYSRKLIDLIWQGVPQDYEWFVKQWYGSDDDEIPGPLDDDVTAVKAPFGVEDILASGVFLDEAELEQTLSRLQSKKNLILQGAPGVGKTFLARKLAYALMEEIADERIEMVQFHQSYSYEDFVRGYRPLPNEGGTFGLHDAVFFKFCEKAVGDPDSDYVFIIDEINRGNLSQIFGELLMLIEADKRGPEFAVPLMYQRPGEPRFFVPPNVYLIGMMNLADRSLAIVDYALRRRFAFMELTPKYGSSVFNQWLADRKMGSELINLIMERLGALNQEIANDPLLGVNYQVGHSFFCPKGTDFSGLNRMWYDEVVETEIVPLLREYWFDNTDRANEARKGLLAP